jgi:P-type E1-E2 ATPase
LLPEDKAALVDATTMMIGDGVNDAAALTAAGVSIAVRGGVAAGLSCADIVITEETQPMQAVFAMVQASDALSRRERLLLLLTVIYNAVAVSAALAGWWGPLICAIGMPLSSIAAVVLATNWQPFIPQKRNQPVP